MSSPIVSRIPSGIEEIDRLWSGLYRGGTYLVYGRTADGRSLLPLMFANAGCENEETCLFIATDRPRSLVIHASLIGFNIKEANKNNLLKLVRFPTLSESRGITDDARAETLSQLLDLVRKNTPTRLVINDLTPFVQFESSDRFRKEMVALLDGLDELNVTSIVALPEPANVHSQRVISFLKSQVVGTLHVGRHHDRTDEAYSLSLIPNVGHITKDYSVDWDLARLLRKAEQETDSDSETKAISIADPAEPNVPAEAHAPIVEDLTKEPVEELPELRVSEEIDLSEHDDTEPELRREELEPAVDQEESDYGQQIITELNKELEGLVQPFEVVTPGQSIGAIKPEVHESRESFSVASDYYFDNVREDGDPFLLIGIRLDRTPEMVPRKFDFEFVSEITQQLLRSYDLILVDEDRQNMVVLLASVQENAADSFFRRLREKLMVEAPKQAGNLMQSIAAIVAVNGEGFHTTAEFLDYIDRSS